MLLTRSAPSGMRVGMLSDEGRQGMVTWCGWCGWLIAIINIPWLIDGQQSNQPIMDPLDVDDGY